MKNNYGIGTAKKKNKSKYIILFLFLFVCNVVITQVLAYKFDYQAVLTGELYKNVYQPFAWISWHQKYYTSLEDTFLVAYSQASFFISILSIFLVAFSLMFKRKEKAYADVHGTAHWADDKEVKAAHVLNREDGVYIGGWKDKKGEVQYLRHNGAEHVLAFAPTRSGKGVGLVIPTLLTWAESTIVLDIKGENYALTSKWREQYANNKIYMFNPNDTTGQGDKFNALEEVRLGTLNEVGDIDNIVLMLLDEKGEGLKDFWEKGGKGFLASFILHILYVSKKEGLKTPSLSLIYKELNIKPLEDILVEMQSYLHHEDTTNTSVSTGAVGLENLSERTRGDILQTVNNVLSLYIDPVIASNISKSDFKLDELMNGTQPVSLYIVIDPESIDRMKPVFRIMMLMILKKLIKKLEFDNGQNTKAYKYRMLLMFDEFPSVGKIDFIEQSIAYMAGYGILFYGIIQDVEQLYKAYGDKETIMSNCHVRIAYTPNKKATASLISDMCGTTTVVKENITTSGKRSSLMLGSVSQTFQEVSRPLLTIDEALRLPMALKNSDGEILEAGKMIIFIGGKSPILGTQILFFKDKIFLDRSKVQ